MFRTNARQERAGALLRILTIITCVNLRITAGQLQLEAQQLQMIQMDTNTIEYIMFRNHRIITFSAPKFCMMS